MIIERVIQKGSYNPIQKSYTKNDEKRLRAITFT